MRKGGSNLARRRAQKPKRRNKEETRRVLLQAGFADIYAHGFQASNVESLLASTNLTKGAFFHHFASKLEFGYAIVDVVIADMLHRQWAVPLERSADPLQTIADSFKAGIDFLASLPVHHGCPLNNLAQEMSSLDPGFRERIQREFAKWKATYAAAFERAKELGQVSRDFPSEQGAHHLLALVEGTLSLAKTSQQRADLDAGHASMLAFIAFLKNAAAWRAPIVSG